MSQVQKHFVASSPLNPRMSLFRYFSPESALRVLASGELMVTPPKYLNDPFECSPVIRCKDPDAYIGRQIDQITTSPEFFETHRNHFPGLTFEEFQSGLLRVVVELRKRLIPEVPVADSHTQSLVQEIISERFGVICFAADGLDQTMWAKYASSHKGLV